MKIKHSEIEIPEQTPFANCKLEREPYANVLTEIIKSYADGFVLAINNEWGAGKTTFVKMWQQKLRNEGFQTLYFNAWENDFDSNPLVALMAELETLTNSKNEKIFKSVVEKGAVLVKSIAPALVKSLIKKYILDIDEVSLDTIENATEASTEIFEEEIKEYALKKKTITDFKEELGKFIEQSELKKPLVFIIDELDRCRPNYSVEVLEQIKHFFSVSGIIFVLSTDKKHLASAVKGFYGSEHIDGNDYLRRFIDLEYTIPKPSVKNFTNYLFDYYAFKDFFYAKERTQYNDFRDDANMLLSLAELLFTKSSTTLRQQERIFAHTRLALCMFNTNEYAFPHLLFVLIYIKLLKYDLFQKINQNELDLQALSDSFSELVLTSNEKRGGTNLVYIEAQLLWFYNNQQTASTKKNLIALSSEGNPNNFFTSRLESNRASYTALFQDLGRKRYSELELNFLLNRVNLIETIKMP
jgi:hypothetical protein